MPADTINIQEIDFIITGPTGAFQISGFAPGTAYTAARDGAAIETAEGADGLNVNAKTNKTAGVLTVNLLTTSTSNAIFQALANLDEDGVFGSGTFSLRIIDRASNVEITSDHCQVMQPADFEASDGIPERSWEIKCNPLKYFPLVA